MATLVGFTANKLILNSSNFRREVVGLERINDVYTARTQDAVSFQEIIKNGATHKTITGYLSPVPSERFENMLVENATSTNMRGDITEFNVTYVGLCRDLSPRPVITLQPIDTYAFNPFSVNLEFIEDIGAIGSAKEIAFIRKYARNASFPDKINGFSTIKSSVPPFSGLISKFAKDFDLRNSQFFKQPISAYDAFLNEERLQSTRISNQGFQFPYLGVKSGREPTVNYLGIAIAGISYTRYGNFAHAIITGRDRAEFSYKEVNGNFVSARLE